MEGSTSVRLGNREGSAGTIFVQLGDSATGSYVGFTWIKDDNGELLFFGRKCHKVGFNFDESSEAPVAFCAG